MKTQNSLQFNMKKNITSILKPCNILEKSSDLLDFYTQNNNPSLEQIIKFAKEKGLSTETVEKYVREKERIEKTSLNIINMKFGFNYRRPDDALVRDYENSIDTTFSLGLELNEELIPKKRKYKESTNINSLWKDVNPKLITELEEYMSHDQKGIIEVKGINTLVSLMKKETRLENKQYLLTVLSNTSFNPAIDRFMHLQGPNVLSDWTSEIKEKIEKNEKFEKSEKYPLTLEVLHLILNISNKLPISVSDLKNSKLGKKINKLGKCFADKQIKQKCETLVNKWKKLISDNKEEKKSFKSKDSKTTEEKSESSAPSSNNYNSSSNSYQRSSYGSSSTSVTKSTSNRNEYTSSSSNENNTTHLYKKRDRREFENSHYDSGDEKQNKRPKYDKPSHSSHNYKYSKEKSSSYKDKKVVKGILKKPIENEKNYKKKAKIRWEPESRMEKVKIFKLTDEPNAPEVTVEEYERIQQEILKNPHRVFEDMRDMRSREINMEKENINKVREKSNKTKEILYQMIPRLPFTILYELKIDDNDNQFVEQNQSLEKEEINQLIQKTFAVKYFRDSEIPDCPKMTKEKFFNYVDPSIPKILNTKRSLDSEKVEEAQKLNPQILHSLQSYIQQNKDKEPEKMHKILDILKNFAFQNNIINENFNFNTSQNLNNSGEDANTNMLHSANPPNLNPINNFNLNPAINHHLPINQSPIINNPIFYFNNEEKINPFESVEKKNYYNNVKPHNYRTKPCRNYNSPAGCSRGDNCHFIHDTAVKAPDNTIPNGIRYPQQFNNKIISGNTEENKDFPKTKEESNLTSQNTINNDNSNSSNNLLNLNNMNLNFINSNSSFVKGPSGNNVIGNMGNMPNKINFPNNNLPHNQFNPNNTIRNPLPLINFSPYMNPVMQNNMIRPSGNMNFPHPIPNINNNVVMNKNQGNFTLNNNTNSINDG